MYNLQDLRRDFRAFPIDFIGLLWYHTTHYVGKQYVEMSKLSRWENAESVFKNTASIR